MLVVETVHLCVSLKCSTDPDIKNKLNWLAVHHVTFELMCPVNFLVVTVYWGVMREAVLLTCPTAATYMHTTVVHILPFLFNIITFHCTDIVIKASHGLYFAPLGIVYGYLNYKATQNQGFPVYDFLPWTDIWSPIFVILLTLCAFIFYISLAAITKRIKRGTKDKDGQ